MQPYSTWWYQIFMFEFEQTVRLNVNMSSVLMFFSLVEKFQLNLKIIEFRSAFLNGRQPKMHHIWIMLPDIKVAKIIGGMYGCRNAACLWYQMLNKLLESSIWTRYVYDICLYFYKKGNIHAYLMVYVDDLVIATNNEAVWLNFENLASKFKFKECDERTYIGIQIAKSYYNSHLHLRTDRYITKIVTDANLENVTLRRTSYMSCVGHPAQ